MSWGTYKKKIYVNCRNCGKIDEQTVKALDIAENMQGQDVLTFICPKCEKRRKSLRFS